MENPKYKSIDNNNDLNLYAGRWVARLENQIIGQGGTPEQALRAAKATRQKEDPEIFFVPIANNLQYSFLLDKVRAAITPEIPVYLVGGAVRDALLNQPTHDLDFVVQGDALEIARNISRVLNAAYYPLDEERSTARLIIYDDKGARHVMDFASFRGSNLENDLRARDFTINALAVDIRNPQVILDPLGGAVDLYERRLRPCSSMTFTNDPLRILRAIRHAIGFNLRILPETRRLMIEAIPQLVNVSSERLRDELVRILGGQKPAAAIQTMDVLGALPFVLPELLELKDVPQSRPHTTDVWNHTIDMVRKLETLLTVLDPNHDPEESSSLTLGLASMKLGRFRTDIKAHVNSNIVPERSWRPLLVLAALYHDIGKPQTRQIDDDGRLRFYRHDSLGEKIIGERAKQLRFSNAEISRLKKIIRHHMRPTLLSHSGKRPSKRAIYRFFRATKEAGVDICLLSLVDLWAAYGTTLPQDRWANHIITIRTLLESWWEFPEESIFPPPLINGNDIMAEFKLESGPIIGRLLEAIREAQATGLVSDEEEARAVVRKIISEEDISKDM